MAFARTYHPHVSPMRKHGGFRIESSPERDRLDAIAHKPSQGAKLVRRRSGQPTVKVK